MLTYWKYIIHIQRDPWWAHFFRWCHRQQIQGNMWHTAPVIHPSSIHPSVHAHSSFPDCCNPREGVFLAVRSDKADSLFSFQLSLTQACRPGGKTPAGPSHEAHPLFASHGNQETRRFAQCQESRLSSYTPVWRGVCVPTIPWGLSLLSLAHVTVSLRVRQMSLVEARRVFSELKCGTFCFCRAIRFPRGHLL